MAEAFPELQITPDNPKRDIQVLLLGTKWQFDTYGLSTINKSLVNNLRLVDPEGKCIKMTCAVVEEEGIIKEEDLKAAMKDGVKLQGAKRPRGSKRGKKPKLQWLDKNTGTYYRHLIPDQNYDFVIGHAPFLANGCLNVKDLYKDKNHSPTTILIFHALPKDENGDVDDETIMDWLKETDVAFSIGKAVDNDLLPYIAALEPDQKPIHNMYLPSYPLELFGIKQNKAESKIRGTQNVCMMSGEIKDLGLSGLDFPLAVTAAAAASDYVQFNEGVKIKLSLLAANEDDKVIWKENFVGVLHRRNLNDEGLSFQAEGPLTLDKMKAYMRKSNLFILPLKSDSPLFGTEALSAIAAGVPVLISKDSGLASLLDNMIEDESIVGKNKLKVNSDLWKERIIQKLVKPDESQIAAKRLREQFLLDTSIAQTHLDFINTIADSTCIQLEMEIQTDSIISEQNMKTAIQFGVEISNPIDAKKYIIAFFKKLLLQREKIDKNLLEAHLDPTITKLWQEVLSNLEETNRKLINIKSGSLVFTLFCPTGQSLLQLQDGKWKIELQEKVDSLMNALGFEAQSQIGTMDSFEPPLSLTTPKLKITDSDKLSLGYETMTKLSDSDSRVIQIQSKVGHWLSHQHDVTSNDDVQPWKLVETWNVDHVKLGSDVYGSNRFSVSESGQIAISCEENPPLSVIYPSKGKSPVTLSNDTIFQSATFVKINGKENLASACTKDGCLYLWDTESKTSKKAFDPKLPKDQQYKNMNICKLRDNTIGYGEANASPDGSRRVFILKTDKEELTLCATLRFFTPNTIWDICYTEVEGYTACLLLCVPRAHHIMAVEMIGAQTRWEVGKEQMGEKFFPWSICTDDDNTVYVADYNQHMIHLLSSEDGSVVTSIDLRQYGIICPFALRFHDQCLYVEYYRSPGKKYAISKFKR